MNAKKYLEQQANRDRQAIMDADNGKTLRALGVDYSSAPKRQRILNGWLIGAASAIASIILIVCVIVFYPTQQQVEYIDVNFESRLSTVSEMNGELHDFSFTTDESIYSVQLTRTHDRLSGDLLYYKIQLNSYDSLIKTEIVAVCNSRFNYESFNFASSTPDQTILPAYKIQYECRVYPDIQYGLDTSSYIAEIDGKTDTIYVTKYTELLIDADGNFFDIIQGIVQPVTNK